MLAIVHSVCVWQQSFIPIGVRAAQTIEFVTSNNRRTLPFKTELTAILNIESPIAQSARCFNWACTLYCDICLHHE